MDHRSASFLVGLVLMQREAFGNLLYLHRPELSWFLVPDIAPIISCCFSQTAQSFSYNVTGKMPSELEVIHPTIIECYI